MKNFAINHNYYHLLNNNHKLIKLYVVNYVLEDGFGNQIN